MQFLALAVWTILVFVAGLLVGRKNPKVADRALAEVNRVRK
jgi:hypothetical protein